MAVYVRSLATGANNGTSWSNAWTSIASALSVAAGETVYIALDHVQGNGSALDLDFVNSTATNRVKLIAADHTSGEPPTVGGFGALVDTTAGSMTFRKHGYAEGIIFRPRTSMVFGDVGTTWNFVNTSHVITEFNAITRNIEITRKDSVVTFDRCGFSFRRELHGLTGQNGAVVRMRNCRRDTSYVNQVPIDNFIKVNGVSGFYLWMEDCDFDGLFAAGGALVNDPTTVSESGSVFKLFANRVSIPAGISWLRTPFQIGGPRIEAYGGGVPGASANSIYVTDLYGVCTESEVILRTGSSSSFSVQMAATALTKAWHAPLRIKLLEKFLNANPTIGAEMVYDRATPLNNHQAWIEVERPTAADPSTTELFTTKPADPLATAGALINSSATWSGTGGFTNERKHRIEHIVSGGGAGMHTVWACVAPGTADSIYFDPDVV